ncbi:Mu-like prophage major head subunit gpT family protein [Leisingera daeponensis]|nr:Mu-like prophage major head subunit gpT family protein [Leisingera daeponensis]
MPKDMFDLPVIGRAATVRPATINEEERTFEVCWTTGATVQRARFVGWDGIEHYDEELSVREDHIRLGRLNNGAPFLDSHRSWDLGNILGVVVDGSVRFEGNQGFATVRFSKRDEVEPVWRDIKDGIIRSVSVGYQVHEYLITKKEGERDHYLAVDWEPMEISAVAIPADAEAQVRSAKDGHAPSLNPCALVRAQATAAAAAEQKGTPMSGKNKAAAGSTETRADDTVETRGNDPVNTPAETVETPAPAATETRAADPAPQPETRSAAEEARAAVIAERKRSGEINRLCRHHGLGDEFAADLIERDVTIDQARAAVLAKLEESEPMNGRSYEPARAENRSEQQREVQYRDALTIALQHRHNPGAVDLSDDAREFRGMTLMEMARHALERRGMSTRGMSKMELAGAAFQMRAAGYHSTSDFPSILANVANKTLRDAYESTQRTFMSWARRSTIVDFKPVQRTQLGGAPDLEKVLENGEFQYGTMGESKEVYALATYGKVLGITRQALINDDMDAFTRIPAAFGASAADLESDIVYAILKDNPTMADGTALFHADHGNLGSAAVINETSLAAAEEAFSKHKGIEGRPISVRPRFLIVPTGQRFLEARKQVAATTPNNTADVNAYAGMYEIVPEPRLLPATGQAPWFLAADPSRIDTVEYAYLDGQEGVFTETRQGFEVDGIEIKARHDFAAKAIDSKGLYKNPGAAPA